MASSTASRPAGQSAGSGSSKRIPATLILRLARTSRLVMASGLTRKALAMRAASGSKTA